MDDPVAAALLMMSMISLSAFGCCFFMILERLSHKK